MLEKSTKTLNQRRLLHVIAQQVQNEDGHSSGFIHINFTLLKDYFKSNHCHEGEHMNEQTTSSLTASRRAFITPISAVLPRVTDRCPGNALAAGTREFIRGAKLSGGGLRTRVDPERIEPNETFLAQKSPFKSNLQEKRDRQFRSL